jgi:hypothetical protein
MRFTASTMRSSESWMRFQKKDFTSDEKIFTSDATRSSPAPSRSSPVVNAFASNGIAVSLQRKIVTPDVKCFLSRSMVVPPDAKRLRVQRIGDDFERIVRWEGLLGRFSDSRNRVLYAIPNAVERVGDSPRRLPHSVLAGPGLTRCVPSATT